LLRQGHNTCTDLYIFETSRLARDLELAARLHKFFDYHKVRVHYVANGMVSGGSGFHLQHALSAVTDQQFSKTLGYNVRRGQLGQLAKGYVAQARCYGYRHVDDLDPAYADSFDRRRRKGVRAVVDLEQAEIVKRIFTMYRTGNGYDAIARDLNRLGIKSPRRPNKNKVRSWSTSSVRTILNNERYVGIVRYGVMEAIRHPETRKIVNRKRDKKDWEVFYFEELRIVTEKDFQAVREIRASRDTLKAQRKAGGLNKGKGTYIWSGLLKCGACGGSISVCQPGCYMCSTFYRRAGCSNNLKLNRLSLERDWTDDLVRMAKQAKSFDCLLDAVMKESERQQEEAFRLAEDQAGSRKNAGARVVELEREINGLTTSLAKHSYSDALSQGLREREAQHKLLVRELHAQQEVCRATLERVEVAEFLSEALEDLSEILRADPETCRSQVRQRVSHLVLTPATFENSPCYEISGDMRLFGQEKIKMLGRKGSIMAEHLVLDLSSVTLQLGPKGKIMHITQGPASITLGSHEANLAA
jgi:site-specific DNA recombinase